MAPLEAILVVLLAQTTPSFDKRFAEVEQLDLARAAAANDEDAARLTLAWLRVLNDVVERSVSDPNLSSRTHPWFGRQTETLFYNEIGGNWPRAGRTAPPSTWAMNRSTARRAS